MARAVATRRPGVQLAGTAGAARFLKSWVFLVPAIALFVGWQLYPIFRVAWISFTDYHFLRTGEPVSWIWFSNYAEAFSDPLVLEGLKRAAIFTGLFLPGMIFIPLFVAILIDRVSHPTLSIFYRLVLLIPAMIPGPLIFVLWKWMYSATIGPINYFLVDVLGVYDIYTAPQWLGDPTLTFPSIVVMEWWWGLGYHTIFFLAGLAAIPRDLYDSARVDGANEWRMFWHVTFPRLFPILLVLVVLRFGTAMALIEEYLIMGGFNRGLPTYTWTVYMWDLGFQLGDWNQAYAAAVGWIGTLAMLSVVVLLFWLFRSRD